MSTSPKFTWYRWDANIGEILALATDVDAARRQVMDTLKSNDAARDDLARAIAPVPQVVLPDEPRAIVAWHQ